MTTLALVDEFDLIDTEVTMTAARGKRVGVVARQLERAKSLGMAASACKVCVHYRWTLFKAHRQVKQLNTKLGALQRSLTGKERQSLMAGAKSLAPLISTVSAIIDSLEKHGPGESAPARAAYDWMFVDPLVAYHNELEDAAETMALASSAELAATLKNQALPLICAR